MREGGSIGHHITVQRAMIAGWRVDLALLKLGLRIKANFDPSQPRVPRGQAEGGRWTRTGGTGDGPQRRPSQGARFAQAGGGSRPPARYRTVRTPQGTFPASPAQETVYEMARLEAESAVRFVRDFNPRWQPRERSLYESINGATQAQNAITREVRTYLDDIRRPLPGLVSSPGSSTPGIGHNGGPPLIDPRLPARSPLDVLAPNGNLVGYRFGGAKGDIRTLQGNEFYATLLELTQGRTFRLPGNGYPGVYYDFPDRCVIGLRVSGRNGLTFELIETQLPVPLDEKIKFHRESR